MINNAIALFLIHAKKRIAMFYENSISYILARELQYLRQD